MRSMYHRYASTHAFQAETKQLLDIVTNSLYTDKEVFLRELISNASDALEKARHLQISSKMETSSEDPLQICIQVDEDKKTITIEDNGVGMSEDELHKNIGQIAFSGSKAFMEENKTQEGSDMSNVIGQFGVGFYASFMVAKDVDVISRSGVKDKVDRPRLWKSTGLGDYTISDASDDAISRGMWLLYIISLSFSYIYQHQQQLHFQFVGTRIVLHLKDECHEFATKAKIKGIIKKYSNFINFPILVDDEKINTVQALWSKSKNEVTDEEHEEFYKFISNAFDKPKYTFHFNADAPISLQALCYIGNQHMEKFGGARMETNVSLYSRKVLIEGKSKHIFPDWLRFVSGVVDSEDLPLSISRENMQDSGLIRKIQSVLTKRIIRFLAEQAKKDTKVYDEFFAEFGTFLKEGVCGDFEHKNDIAKLLRFESSRLPTGELTSLDDYISRCESLFLTLSLDTPLLITHTHTHTHTQIRHT